MVSSGLLYFNIISKGFIGDVYLYRLRQKI